MMDSRQPTADATYTGGEANSPQPRRPSLSSPWASVVRGDPEQNSSPDVSASGGPGSFLSPPPPEQSSGYDSSLIEGSGSDAPPESSDSNSDSNAGRPRRSAWRRLVGDGPEPGSVMGGAVSWPALSETSRPVPRSSSDVPSPVSDGSVTPSQVPTVSQSSQRPANNSGATNSASDDTTSARQRPRNRGGGSSSASGALQNAFTQQPLQVPSSSPVLEVPHNMVPPDFDGRIRGLRPTGGVGGSQSHTGTDHPQRNKSRWGAYGHRFRGDRGQREQGRRDVHHPLHFAPAHFGGFIAPPPLPPGAGPFMPHPPPIRVFPGQMGFDAASSYIYFPAMPPDMFRPMQMVPPQPPFYPANDTLSNLIIKQVDFYFSDDNLAKDNFLRSKMDGSGWVPITLIASFPRVQRLTKDIPVILESLKNSAFVEVQGDKVRRRNEWKKWLPSSSWINTDSVSKTPAAPANELAAPLQELSLNCSTGSPDELTRQVGLANAEDKAEGIHVISV